MEEAYLGAKQDRAKWKPRKRPQNGCSHRRFLCTWLVEKEMDRELSRDLNTSDDQKSKQVELGLISQFSQLHPNAITDLKKLNQSRHAALNKQKNGQNADEDAFGNQVQWVPSGKGVKAKSQPPICDSTIARTTGLFHSHNKSQLAYPFRLLHEIRFDVGKNLCQRKGQHWRENHRNFGSSRPRSTRTLPTRMATR